MPVGSILHQAAEYGRTCCEAVPIKTHWRFVSVFDAAEATHGQFRLHPRPSEAAVESEGGVGAPIPVLFALGLVQLQDPELSVKSLIDPVPAQIPPEITGDEEDVVLA